MEPVPLSIGIISDKSMNIYVKKLFSYKDGTGPASPQKKIIKSKIGTGDVSPGPVLQNLVYIAIYTIGGWTNACMHAHASIHMRACTCMHADVCIRVLVYRALLRGWEALGQRICGRPPSQLYISNLE